MAEQGAPAPAPETKERERQKAVAPLDTIAPQDIAAASKFVDDWLRGFTGGYVTLERLTMVLGSIPVVGNIMALVDVFVDVIVIFEKKAKDSIDEFMNWVSLGINLIGLIPLPVNMAAARMSLRPTLHLVRQQLRNTASNLGEALITVLTSHLNATLAGTLDKHIEEAIGLLDDLLKKCADLCDAIVDNLCSILKRVIGQEDLFNVNPPAPAAKVHDPRVQSTWNSMWASAVRMSKQTANFVSKAAASRLPDGVTSRINGVIASLTDFKGNFRTKLAQLANANEERSLKWLMHKLLAAVRRKKVELGASIPPAHGAQASAVKPSKPLGTVAVQAKAYGDGGTCPYPPTGTKRAINFALGTESFSHTDFVLPAPLAIAWHRTYRSDLVAYDKGSLGARWTTPFSSRVDIANAPRGPREGQPSFVYHDADGRSHAFPVLSVGQSHRDPIEQITATRLSETLLILDFGKTMPAGEQPDWRETYELVPAKSKTDRGPSSTPHFRLIAQHARDGAAIGLRYDHVLASGEEVLSDILSKQGDVTLAHVGLRPDATTGRIESVWELKDGQIVRQLAGYTYDASGDLIAAQDENGASWSYRYSHHLVTRYTDRTGRGTNLQYDGTGAQAKAIREWADDGSLDTRLEWDKNIRLTYVTDALGQETWYYYDILGYTYRIVHPDGQQEWFFRDEAKNVTRHVHPDGSTDDYVYNPDGNLQTHTRADGSRVHFEYDKSHRLTGLMDGEGGVWKRDYNPQGHLTEETDPLGHVTRYAYDKAGRPVRITDAKGGIKKLAYTPAGQLASYTDCSSKTTRWDYDSRGRLAQSTDAAGQTTRYRYTTLTEQTLAAATQEAANHPGQLESVTLPDATREQFAHDAEGRLLAHTDPLQRQTRYRYDATGQIAGRTDAAGHTLAYQWDKLGRLTQLQNENGAHYRFAYDPVGRLLEEVGFDGKATKYRYEDTTGVLAEVTEAGLQTHLQFDPLGRLTERKIHDQPGTDETFGYDRNGRLVEARNQHAKLQWFHDEAGNLTREHHADLLHRRTAVWKHHYDELNQRIGTIRPDGHVTEWLSYGSGHVHGLLLDGEDILAFERDDLHREVSRAQHNGLHQSQRWDPAGRLLAQQLHRGTPPVTLTRSSPAPVIERNYHYDKAGQLIIIGDSRRGRLEYRYDPIGRLLEANGRLGKEIFAFDPAGNIADPVAFDPASAGGSAAPSKAQRIRMVAASKLMDNLLKDYAGTHYTYDARGNLIERTANARKTTFGWDGFNRMVSAKTEEGETTFRYDPLGRRIAKTSAAGETIFGWDGDVLAFESTTRAGKDRQADTVHYIHEKDSFVPLVQARRQQSIQLSVTTDVKALMQANGGRYDIEQDPLWNGQQEQRPTAFTKEEIAFYQCDHLGTPQELTDHEGNIAWSASYKAWGEAKEVISEAAKRSGLTNPIRFQGQYLDDETGLHYNRYRYYEPGSGQFTSSDPIRLTGGLNLHAYTKNPIGWIDPFGLAAGRATVFWHDNRNEDNVFGHYSIETDVDGRKMTTHQLGAPGTQTVVSTNLRMLPPPAKQTSIELPDATATQKFQRDNVNEFGGTYDTKTRSCVTHVGEVLRAGGVDIPSQPGPQLKYLKKRGV
ncbi:RHS repeat-associated core domain-containing protein [Variovorax rhizosphaerae]|uniref:RHS repeat-associated core domain-containing protein n=1 Tax=Variovorax rhizosphaerae TaxID=1836200 RepID=A0ABU8WWK2_9BURK